MNNGRSTPLQFERASMFGCDARVSDNCLPDHTTLPSVSRRTLLKSSAALAGVGITVVAAGTAAATPAAPAVGFAHGVASGDPLPDRVIIWTRVTPSADADPAPVRERRSRWTGRSRPIPASPPSCAAAR